MSASYKVLFARELAASPDGKGGGMARAAVEGALRNYWPRVAMLILGASLAASAALAVFLNPLLFGTQYAESIEATKITALLLPALIVLAILGLGLMLPADLPARAHRAWAKSRSRSAPSRILAPRIDMPLKPEEKGIGRGAA
jgi:hypothetical protein